MILLNELTKEEKHNLAKKIQIGINKMFKNQVYYKEIDKIIDDLKIIEKEIDNKKAFFRVYINNNNIEGFYYIRVNDTEKFIKPFFETEFFYSETPKSFFKCLKFATKDLEFLKNKFPHISNYIAYYTVDDFGEYLSHAKISNERIRKVFENKISFKDVFKTSVGKVI